MNEKAIFLKPSPSLFIYSLCGCLKPGSRSCKTGTAGGKAGFDSYGSSGRNSKKWIAKQETSTLSCISEKLDRDNVTNSITGCRDVTAAGENIILL